MRACSPRPPSRKTRQLLGFCAGVQAFGHYRHNMHAAARFLRDSLDEDGCWRSHPTPYASAGEKAYETHVSWGLFESERLARRC